MGHYDSDYEFAEEERRKGRTMRGSWEPKSEPYTVSVVGEHNYFGTFYVVENSVWIGSFAIAACGEIRELAMSPAESLDEALRVSVEHRRMLKALRDYVEENE